MQLLSRRPALRVLTSWRRFSTGQSPKKLERLRSSSLFFNSVHGRDDQYDKFAQRIHLVHETAATDIYADWDSSVAVVVPLKLDQVDEPIPHPAIAPAHSLAHQPFLPMEVRRNLLKNSDSWMVQHGNRPAIYVVEPMLSSEVYRYAEALVEMISAFRNILSELEDAPQVRKLRIPVMSMDCHHPNITHMMPRLHQQAVDSAFQRIKAPLREELVHSTELQVEIYVPPDLYTPFFETFKRPPYEIPMERFSIPDTMHPFYNNMPPPSSLREYPPYIGKRKEIEEAIERGEPVRSVGSRGLDGRLIQESDVPTTLPLLPDYEERNAYLEAERQGAIAEGYTPPVIDPLASAPAPDLPRFD